MEITTTSSTLPTFHPFRHLPPELRHMIWHYAFSDSYVYRRFRKVNLRRLRFHLQSMHIPYEDLPLHRSDQDPWPRTWKWGPCRRVGIGLCHVGEDGEERGVYFARARHHINTYATKPCSVHPVKIEGLFPPTRDILHTKHTGYTALGGMPALLHSCREGRRVVLEEWKTMVRVKYETPDEYVRGIDHEDWRSDNRVRYEAHMAIIDGLLEDLKRAEEGNGLWRGLSMWNPTKEAA